MARRRTKNRTHLAVDNDKNTSIPKSICVRLGSLAMKNKSLKQLTHDFRLVLSPHTAIRLKELTKNKLKDFIVMCSPLNVTHLFTFTQSNNNDNDIYMKLGKLHNGPTVTFKVNEYSLIKDINRFKNKSINTQSLVFQESPLLVINGFKSEIPQEKIIISLFQNIYPPINPMQKKIDDIKRVLLVNKLEDGTVEVRHYAIVIKDLIDKTDTKAKNIDKLLRLKNDSRRTIPNLEKKKDISSLVLEDLGYMTSDNESEIEDEQIIKEEDEIKKELEAEAEILAEGEKEQTIEEEIKTEDEENKIEAEIKDEDEEDGALKKQKLNDGSSKRSAKGNKKAIKLQEIGPRLSLSLLKIESDLFKGETLYHSYIKKSNTEVKELQKRHDEKNRLKEQRKKEQEANLLKKKEAKEEKKRRKDERRQIRKEQNENESSEDKGKSVSEDDSLSEDEYADIPEDIDSDLLSEIDENPSDDE